MDRRGFLSPETAAEAREQYDELGAPAQHVVKESAKAMAFEKAEYDERVTGDVVATARDALFASLLVVQTGTRAEFEDWRDDYEEYEIHRNGSENVDNVAWHVVPFAETIVTATYQNEPDAAVATLRRVAYGQLYRNAI